MAIVHVVVLVAWVAIGSALAVRTVTTRLARG
jgi:hypothetical protein